MGTFFKSDEGFCTEDIGTPDSYSNTSLSEQLAEINDGTGSTVEEKIKQLTTTLAGNNIKLNVINF